VTVLALGPLTNLAAALGTIEITEAVLGEFERAAVIPTLLGDEGGPARFLTSLAEAYVQGTEVAWTEAFADCPTKKGPSLSTFAETSNSGLRNSCIWN